MHICMWMQTHTHNTRTGKQINQRNSKGRFRYTQIIKIKEKNHGVMLAHAHRQTGKHTHTAKHTDHTVEH